jgi:hypothetical protein
MPIFEERYQTWIGKPQPRPVRVAILAREEIKLILSSLWMKIAVGLLLILAAGLSFLFFVRASLNVPAERMFAQFFGNVVYRTYLSFDSILIVALAAIVGSGLISKDLRTNANLIYFSRPIGKIDYLVGKFCAALTYMALGTLVPVLFLWVSAIVFKVEDIGWLSRFKDLGSILAHSLLIIVPVTSMILAFSACSRWTAAAGIVWVMMYLASASLGEIGSNMSRDTSYELLSLQRIWISLGDFLYEDRVKTPAREHPYGLLELIGVLAAITAASWAVLVWRVQKIERL